MSDSNRASLAYTVNDSGTYGTVPSGPPTFQELRVTSESLKQATNMVRSNEVRADRQVPDIKRVALDSQGAVNFELSFDAYDDWLLWALMHGTSWTAAVDLGTITDIQAVNSGNKFVVSATDISSLVANQWIKVSGFTESANNGFFKIVSTTSTDIVVSGGTLTDEPAGDSVSVLQGAYAENGTTATDFIIERTYNDLSNEFALYKGLMIDRMDLTIQTEQLVTGTFQLVGLDEVRATSTAGDGSNTAAPTNSIMGPVDELYDILENQATKSVMSLSMSLQNNIRHRRILGNAGPESLGVGSIGLTGTLRAYYATKDLVNKYLNQTASAIAWILEDGDGNAYLFDLPHLKYVDSATVIEGKDGDVIEDMSWEAIMDSVESKTFRIAKFPAA
jgi:hypothetical protein